MDSLLCYCGQAFPPQSLSAHLAICPTRAEYSQVAYNLNHLRTLADPSQLEIVKGELQLEISVLESEIAALRQYPAYR
jgi:hypothetical protein